MKAVLRMISFRQSAAGVFFLALPACAPMTDVHGDALDPQTLASLQTGKTPYTEVQAKLGSPSSKAVFDGEDWIYIHSKQERKAFFKPEETQRTVTVLRFGRDGILREIETKTLADGRAIVPAAAETETNEKSLTVLDQMISNVGRMTTDAPVH